VLLLSTVVVKSVIENLVYTGLSEYEARAYVGLLGKNPATAYELARASGIPTSKIYEVVSRLEEKGIISPVAGEGTRKFIPLSPAEFVASRESMMQSTLTFLTEGLPSVSKGVNVPHIWNVNGRDHLMERACMMAREAGRTLLVSIWPDEMGELLRDFRGAELRGVKIAVVHFGAAKEKVGQLYQHPADGTIYAEKGGRGLCVVSDASSALMGTMREMDAEGAFSANAGFVTLAEDYIRHDIYVLKMVRRFDRDLMERFGPRYEKLRDVFVDGENA
jgi:sugar-specific transcriptional regulator TrmB